MRYSDSRSILSAYSLEQGRISFLMPAGAGREAGRRKALLMPLSVVECVADIKPGREIHNMREPQSMVQLTSLRANPLKNAMTAFLAEFLSMILRESQTDPALFQFVRTSVEALEAIESSKVANFHLCFLIRLCRFIGIEPDWDSYTSGKLFDISAGIFRTSAPMHRNFLSPEESKYAHLLSRINYRNMHRYRLNRHSRRELLDQITHYYSMHYAGLSSMKSLEVLATLF